MNELQAQEVFELEEERNERAVFVIKDLEGLNWAFRKLNAIHAAIKEKEQLAQAEKERIETWLKAQVAPLKQDIDHFEHIIKQFHADVLASDPKQKSISTPYGKVKSTTTKAAANKIDDTALLQYVKENELPFVEVKESLKWGELKKNLKVVENDLGAYVIDEFGQIVPGVEVKPMTTTYKVEVSD